MLIEVMENRSEGLHIGDWRAEWPRAWILEPGRTGFDCGSAADLHKLFNISEPQFPPLRNGVIVSRKVH